MEDERELSYPLQVYFAVDRFGIIEMPSHSVGNVRANGVYYPMLQMQVIDKMQLIGC